MLRPFQESDLDACVDLYIATFAQPPWSETWERPLDHARLQQIVRTPGFWGAVILSDDHVIGFALGIAEPWHEGDHFYLKEMCIVPVQQRQGLGTQLLEFMTQELAAAGTRRRLCPWPRSKPQRPTTRIINRIKPKAPNNDIRIFYPPPFSSHYWSRPGAAVG